MVNVAVVVLGWEGEEMEEYIVARRRNSSGSCSRAMGAPTKSPRLDLGTSACIHGILVYI